jgi:2,4'-dihydroxyacetophenone dioxygenase
MLTKSQGLLRRRISMTVSEALQVVRHAGDQDIPWIDTGTGVELKLLRIDRTHGTWVIRNRFQPGVQLQTHKHTGTVDGFTLTGRWHYLEYDFVSTAGSYIHEPANSVHTLTVPEDNSELTDVLFVIEGSLLNLTPEGQVEYTTDAESILEVYYAFCEQQGHGRPSGILFS